MFKDATAQQLAMSSNKKKKKKKKASHKSIKKKNATQRVNEAKRLIDLSGASSVKQFMQDPEYLTRQVILS